MSDVTLGKPPLRKQEQRSVRKARSLGSWLAFTMILTIVGFGLLAAIQANYLSCPATISKAANAQESSRSRSAEADVSWINSYAARDRAVLASEACPAKPGAFGWLLAPHALAGRPMKAPALWLWLDNVLIAIYSTTFVLGYFYLTHREERHKWRWPFRVLIGVAAIGALCDYIENFLLLGGLDSAASAFGQVAREAAPFTAGKFIFFIINLTCLVLLGGHRLWSRRRQ